MSEQKRRIPLSPEFIAEVQAMGIDGAADEIARLRSKLGALESMARRASNGHVCGTPGCPLCALRLALETS